MSKNSKKPRDTFRLLLLGVSYLAGLSYLVFLFPNEIQEIYGSISSSLRGYWLSSGIIYIVSLIGLTLRKKFSIFPFIAIVLSDALVSLVFMDGLADSIFNLGLAIAWSWYFYRHRGEYK